MALGGWFGGGSSSSDNSSSSSKSSDSSSSSSPLPFGSSPSPFGGPSIQNDTKTKLISAINQQQSIVNAKFLIQKITENCFEKCVPEPGASLSSKEQTCLGGCFEKYVDGWNTVSKTHWSRLRRELPQGVQVPGGPGEL